MQSLLSTYIAITSTLQMNEMNIKDYNSSETSSQGIATIQNSLALNKNTGQHIHIYRIYKIWGKKSLKKNKNTYTSMKTPKAESPPCL